MARGKNPDYFTEAGISIGRRGYARERRKLGKGRDQPPGCPLHTPASKASGAGVQTAERARSRRAGRKASADAPTELKFQAGVAPDHQLPPATRSTRLLDLLRDLRVEAHTGARAARELWGCLTGLLRGPVRLLRLLRAAQA